MKTFRTILLILFALFLIILVIGLFAGRNNDDFSANPLAEMNEDELKELLHELSNDSWSGTHLALMNYKMPENNLLKKADNSYIVVNTDILAKDHRYFYIGADAKRNVKCEFANQDDFEKISKGDSLILYGFFEAGSLPVLKNVVIIDVEMLKNRIRDSPDLN